MAKQKVKLAPITDFTGGWVLGPTPTGAEAGISPNLVKRGFNRFTNIIIGENKKPLKRVGYELIDDYHYDINAALQRPINIFVLKYLNSTPRIIYIMKNDPIANPKIYYKNGEGGAIEDITGSGLPNFTFSMSCVQDPITGNVYLNDWNGQHWKWLFKANSGSTGAEDNVRINKIETPTTGPTLTPAAGTLSGEYRWRYTFVYNTATETELSTNYSTWTGVNAQIDVSITNPGNGYVSFMRIYRTKDLTGLTPGQKDAAPYYFIEQIAVDPPGGADPNYVDATDDTELVDEATFYGYVEPNAVTACYSNDRMFMAGGELVYMSDPAKSDSFRAVNTFLVPKASTKNNNVITNIRPIGDTIYIYLEDGGMYKLVPTQSTETPYILREVETEETYGVRSPNSVATLNGVHYFIWNREIYTFNGTSFKRISDNINPILREVWRYAFGERQSTLVSDEVQQVIHCFVRGSYFAPYHLVFQPQYGTWAFWTGYRDIAPSTIKGYNMVMQTASIDSDNGDVFYIDEVFNIMKQDIYGSGSLYYRDENPETGMTPVYNVESILEKWYNFGKQTFINSLALYCQHPAGTDFKIITRRNEEGIPNVPPDADKRTLKAKQIGGELPINSMLQRLKVWIAQDNNGGLDLDYFELKAPAGQRVVKKDQVGA